MLKAILLPHGNRMPKTTIPEKWLHSQPNHLTSRFEITSHDIGLPVSRILALNDNEHIQNSEIRKMHKELQPYVPANSYGGAGGFHSWLVSQGKTQRTIKEYVSYARRFASVLDTGDASIIINTIKPETQHHVLTALANWSKYTGRYEQFNQIRRQYNLKWTKADSIKHFQRFFDEQLSLENMLQRIRQMVHLLPAYMARIIKFACLIGLRASEVLEAVRLLNICTSADMIKYYNSQRQTLEHFRFPEIFLRQTKKAYISFVTPEMLPLGIPSSKVPTRNAITHACQRRNIKMDMYLTRKIFASWLRKEGIQPEIVDLLQGRVSQSVLTRHYLVPQQGLKDQVLQALEKLQQEIEEK